MGSFFCVGSEVQPVQGVRLAEFIHSFRLYRILPLRREEESEGSKSTSVKINLSQLLVRIIAGAVVL